MKIKALFFFLLVAIAAGAQAPRLVIPTAHNAWVTDFAVSPDGKWMASSDYSNIIKLWNFPQTMELRTLYGHTDVVGALQFSPDNQLLASGSWDGEVRIWSVKTGKQLYTYHHYGQVNDLHFSPDGNYLASTGNDSLLFVFSRAADSVVQSAFLGGSGYKVRFHPDGNYILVLDDDTSNGHNVISYYDIREKDFDTTGMAISYRHGNIIDFDLSPDGKRIYSLLQSDSGQIRVFYPGEKTDRMRFNGHRDYLVGICATDSADIIYTMSKSKEDYFTYTHQREIKKWDLRLQRCVDSFQFTAGTSETLKFIYSPAAQTLVTAKNSINFLLLKPGPLRVKTVIRSMTSLLNNIFILPDRSWITTNDKGAVSRISFSGPFSIQPVYQDEKKSPMVSILSPDSSSLYMLSLGNNRGVNRLQFPNMITKPAWITDTLIEGFTASPSGKLLACNYGDRSLLRSYKSFRIVDLQKNRVIADTSFYVGGVNGGYLFTADEQSMILGHNWSDTILVWNFISGGVRYLHEPEIRAVPMSLALLDNQRLLTAHRNRKGFYTWDIRTGKFLSRTLTQETEPWIETVLKTPPVIFSRTFEGSVEMYDRVSLKVKYRFPNLGAAVSRIGFAGNNNRVYTYSLDNVMRFWQLNPRKLLFSYIPVDTADFMLLTPAGYYYASRPAARQLYYVTPEYNIISFEQLDIKYNRPDKVLEAMGSKDALLIRSFKKAWEKRIKKLGIDTTAFRDGYSVPEADIANREELAMEQSRDSLTLHIRGRDRQYAFDRFNVWVNEVPVFGQRGISIRKQNSRALDTVIGIRLSEGENRIETSITNVNGTESYRMPLLVNHVPPQQQKIITRFIGIGIDQFAEREHNLQYSSKDIRDLAIRLKQKYGNDIIIDTLFNRQVTVNNIKSLKQALRQTSVNDKVIIAYSGHGLLGRDFDYFLSTYDISFSRPEQNGLPYEELENLLDSIPARRKLLLIDACHSGEVDKDELARINSTAAANKLAKGATPVAYAGDQSHLGIKNSFELMQNLFVNVGKSTGSTIISAAAGTQFALERGDLENGVFTYSILEAMEKFATMKISELKRIVGKRVEELTNGLQKPTSRNETIAVDWSLW